MLRCSLVAAIIFAAMLRCSLVAAVVFAASVGMSSLHSQCPPCWSFALMTVRARLYDAPF
jgi:hypothetical protein